MAFTATSVLLVLLLVILARMFQTKFKAHFPVRSVPWLRPGRWARRLGGGGLGSEHRAGQGSTLPTAPTSNRVLLRPWWTALDGRRRGEEVSAFGARSWAGLNSFLPTVSSCAPGGQLRAGAGGVEMDPQSGGCGRAGPPGPVPITPGRN